MQEAARLIAAEERSVGGGLGPPSSARRRTYNRLTQHAKDIEGTLFSMKALEQVIDTIYRYPLQQTAKNSLNRQLRSSISNEDLASRVIDLWEAGQLCIIDEEDQDHKNHKLFVHWGFAQTERKIPMQINGQKTRQYLKQFDFQSLFITELGWDYHTQTLNVEVGESRYTLTAVAEKRGMVVFECQADTTGSGIPDSQTRRKIQREVAKSVHENFVIYTDAEKTTQIWQCARREHGKPTACPEHRYDLIQHGDSLIQKLDAIAVSFEEEEGMTLFGVTSRVQASFYVEKVTRGFYNHFKREQTAFLGFLSGIPDQDMQQWYAAVMLNRLMFIYFIQKKVF